MNEDDEFEFDKTLGGHRGWVWDCDFSFDSAFLISVSTDPVIRIWHHALWWTFIWTTATQALEIKHYSSEEKIRMVLDGLRGEDSIAELCRREGISQGIYWTMSGSDQGIQQTTRSS